MPTDSDGVLEQTELEHRAGAENLDALHAKRRQILEANKKLIALHGSFGLFEAFRKKMVSAQKIAVRLSPLEGIKVTDDSVDAMAHATDAYGTFLDTALDEKVDCIAVLNEIAEIEERIRNREEVLRCWRREAGLQ